jgi:hypothetical protein
VEHPKDIGDRSTLAVMVGLKRRGYEIAVPFGENTRYDLVIDDGHTLARVQCKSGQLRAGAIHFKTASSYAHHRSSRQARRHYHGQIDFFAVYCPDTHGVYLLPIDDVAPRCEAALRVEPSRNGQKKRIRLAADYQIAVVNVPSVTVKQAPRATSGAR